MARIGHWKEAALSALQMLVRLTLGALALHTLKRECVVAARCLPANLRAAIDVFFFGATPTAAQSAGRPFRTERAPLADAVPQTANDAADDADAEDTPATRKRRSVKVVPPLSVSPLPPTALVVPFVPSRRPAWPEAPLVEESDSSAAPMSTLAIPRRPPTRRRRGKVLVLDLDDTLICSATSATRYGVPPTYCEAVATASGAELFHIWERPDVHTFLRCVAEWYSVAVFTAASASYANPIIDRLDPTRKLIRRRYYRGDCTPLRPGSSAMGKDLAKLAVPLRSVVLLDNCRESLQLQPENGLLVASFVPPPPSLFEPGPASPRAKPDMTLLSLLPFLEALSHVRDVRSVLRIQSR